MVLGVYADLLYRRDGEALSTDRAFVLFVTALAERLDGLVLFGRLDPVPGRSEYVLPDGVRFVPLPHYPRTSDLVGLARALRASRRAFARELPGLDAAWLFGPHPVALAFALEARRRRVPVVLGIRQSFPEYVANRLPSRAWLPAVGVAHGLEQAFRALARRVPAVVVGDDLGRKYAAGRAPVLATGFSLIRQDDLVPLDEALARDWSGPVRLLSVGRLEPEKNPLLMAEIVALLRGRGLDVGLDVVGVGRLNEALRARAGELGVGGHVRLHGYVRNGPPLWERYRAAHALLHVSLTEGLPQVLFEAEAAGLPIVATDVGGVRDALGGGERGLLVPPQDAEAAARAVERLHGEEQLRRRLTEAALAHAAEQTLDAQLDRIADFLRAASRPPRAPARP